MPDMTLSEAAKWAGVTIPTIHKALTGKLKGRQLSGQKDENGRWRINPAELERVFPRRIAGNVTGNGSVSGSDIVEVMAGKDREIALLREMVVKAERSADDLRLERDRLLGLVETAQRQLTDQRQPQPAKPAWRFWKRG